MKPELILPSDFDEDFWLVETKGWFPASVSFGGRVVEVIFYDPVRLAQDVEATIASDGVFAAQRIVVMPAVTRAAMDAAARALPASFFE